VFLLLSFLAGGATGVVVWEQVTEPVEVLEPFTVGSTIPSSFSLYPGETRSYEISVSNASQADLKAKVVYSIDPDYDGDGVLVDLEVTVSPSESQLVPAGGSVTFTVSVKVDADSPAGQVSIVWRVERG